MGANNRFARGTLLEPTTRLVTLAKVSAMESLDLASWFAPPAAPQMARRIDEPVSQHDRLRSTITTFPLARFLP